MKRPSSKFAYAAGVVLLSCFAAAFAPSAPAAPEQPAREYQVKAVFLLNFARFIEWPEERHKNRPDHIVIGVLGEDPFGKILDSIRGKRVKGKDVVVKTCQRIEDVYPCEILFIPASEKDNVKKHLSALDSTGVVTVGEVKGFTEMGGTINFVIGPKQTVRFEINTDGIDAAGVRVSSQLLNLAVPK